MYTNRLGNKESKRVLKKRINLKDVKHAGYSKGCQDQIVTEDHQYQMTLEHGAVHSYKISAHIYERLLSRSF